MQDLMTAIEAIRAKQPAIQLLVDYYDGNHANLFSTDKFKRTFGRILSAMRANLCPTVVDSTADRMEIINFSGDKTEEGKAVATKAWEIWQRNGMEILSNEVHREAIKTGEAYVLVWENDDGEAVCYLQDSRNCAVIESEETGKAEFAAKMWLTRDFFLRVTLYYPDKIEKYITKAALKTGNGAIDLSSALKEDKFEQFNTDGEPFSVPNPYGVIPMFKFSTDPILKDCIPIQDALNKTLRDLMVAQEFAAYPQRYATGLELPTNKATGKKELSFEAGVDRLWFSADPTTNFGQFAASDLTQYLQVANEHRLDMARISGTPIHFFSLNTSDAMSGEALKTLESKFTKRISRLCLNFGRTWAKAEKLMLVIEKAQNGNLTAQWESPEPRSEREILETKLLKKQMGVPDVVLQEEISYTPEDIQRFKKLLAEEANTRVAIRAEQVLASPQDSTRDIINT